VKRVITGGVLSVLVACSSRPATPETAAGEVADSSELAVTRPVGASPCGGPARYLVYSVAATDSARLAGAVAAFNAREQRRVEGTMGACVTPAPPRPACLAGTCGDAR
jgi:hypothetical protein